MLNLFKRFLFFAFLHISPFFFSQSWYHYKWDETKPEDFGNLYESIYKFNLNKYKESIYVGKFYETFSKEHAAQANYDVFFGNFYKSLEGYESYVRKVLNMVVKDTAIANTIKIFFYRDTELNASMDGSGVLRLNVGALTKLKNEAELAMLLAHEASHFINEDAVKNYGRNIESVYNPMWNLGSFNEYGAAYLLYVDNPVMQLMEYSREQDGFADFTGIKFLKNNTHYSLKSGSNLFKTFKRQEIKLKILYGSGYDKRYNSHPDPGDRIKQVKLLSDDSVNKGRKNFLIDSVSFTALQNICFQETANLLLEHFEYDELIELCFAKYLLEPDNKHNLALLMEGLWRKMNIEKKDKPSEKSFILWRYQTKHVKSSENYSFLNEEKPSILKYLTKGFIDINKEDLPKIKARELADQNTVEFFTNKEAFDYFEKKARELNCRECLHYRFYTDKPDTSGLMAFLNENSLFETAEYLRDINSIAPSGEDIFIVNLPDLVKISEILNRKTLSDQMHLYDTIVTLLKNKFGPRVYKMPDMKYKDQHMINELSGLCAYYSVPKRNGGIYRKNESWVCSYPELYSFFKRNHARNLYVFDFNLFLDQNKKATEYSKLKKISLPDKKSASFSAELKENSTKVEEGVGWFLTRVVNQANFFYSSTK